MIILPTCTHGSVVRLPMTLQFIPTPSPPLLLWNLKFDHHTSWPATEKKSESSNNYVLCSESCNRAVSGNMVDCVLECDSHMDQRPRDAWHNILIIDHHPGSSYISWNGKESSSLRIEGIDMLPRHCLPLLALIWLATNAVQGLKGPCNGTTTPEESGKGNLARTHLTANLFWKFS